MTLLVLAVGFQSLGEIRFAWDIAMLVVSAAARFAWVGNLKKLLHSGAASTASALGGPATFQRCWALAVSLRGNAQGLSSVARR